MKKIRMFLVFLLMPIMLFGISSSAALADSIGFDLTVPNGGLAGIGPYLHVALSRTDTTHATLTVTSYLISGGSDYNYYFGGNAGFAVNVNGYVTYSDIAVTLADGTTGSYASVGTPGNVSDFGSFNAGVQFRGSLHTVKTLVFTLTDTSGTWASASEVLTENGSGYLAAAHVFPFNGAGVGLATGYAGDGPPQVPEPTTLFLLGLGLVGLAGIRRKMK